MRGLTFFLRKAVVAWFEFTVRATDKSGVAFGHVGNRSLVATAPQRSFNPQLSSQLATMRAPLAAIGNTSFEAATMDKASIKFIMNDCDDRMDDSRPAEVVGSIAIDGMQRRAQRTARALSNDEKRRARECKVDGCDKYIINRGLCFRHGGGKKCSIADCTSSAKNAGLCWRHGGSVKCLVDGCERRGKSRGLCWAHGGGTKCSDVSCAKVAVSNGYCWAHGGGKRCALDGCRRAAYERTHNYCTRHFEELRAEGVA